MSKDDSKKAFAQTPPMGAEVPDQHGAGTATEERMAKDGKRPAKGAPVPNSQATQWRKGVSGNPGGRPRGLMSRALRRRLRKVVRDAEGNETRRADLLAEDWIKQAGKDPKYMGLLLDRSDGPVEQKDKSSVKSEPIEIVNALRHAD
jgi:hypothetical protein